MLRGMWDLPEPGLEPLSTALAGGFLSTAPPGKPSRFVFKYLKERERKREREREREKERERERERERELSKKRKIGNSWERLDYFQVLS